MEERWLASARETLREAGISEIAPRGPDEKQLRLVFRYRGVACVFAEESVSKTRLPLLGILPARELCAGEAAEIPFVALRPPTAGDRLGVGLGLNRPVRTGDVGFDARVYIETDASEAQVQALLRDASARAAVQTLMDGQAQEVRLGEYGCLVTLRAKHHFDPAGFPAQLDALLRIAQTLPFPRTPPRPFKGLHRAYTRLAALGASALVIWWCPLFFAPTIEPLEDTFWMVWVIGSVALWLVALLLSMLAVARRTYSLSAVTVCAFSWMTIAPSCMCLTWPINRHLPSAADARPAYIDDVRCERGGDPAECVSVVRTLHDGAVLHVAAGVGSGGRGGAVLVPTCGPATLTIARGALGFRYVHSLERTPGTPPAACPSTPR